MENVIPRFIFAWQLLLFSWNSIFLSFSSVLLLMSHGMRFPTMWYVTTKGSDQPAHMRSLIRAFASHFNILWILSDWLDIIWSVSKLKRWLHRLVWVYDRMPHCWKSRATAHFLLPSWTQNGQTLQGLATMLTKGLAYFLLLFTSLLINNHCVGADVNTRRLNWWFYTGKFVL